MPCANFTGGDGSTTLALETEPTLPFVELWDEKEEEEIC